MPVDFLTESQKERYANFVGDPSLEDLARYFHFDDADRELINKRRGTSNRLGFALQLGTVRFLGAFLSHPVSVPPSVIAYVSRQLEITNFSSLSQYVERDATRLEHIAEIRSIYGYQSFNDPSWRFRLCRWLYTRAWLTNERPNHLFDLATHWLIQRKILLPGATTLTRLIAQIRDRASRRAWKRLAALPNKEQCRRLEALLPVAEGDRRSRFDQLRQSPTRVSSTSMISALARYEEIRSLGVRELDFSQIPPMRLKALARYAATGWAPSIARMPVDRRIATLVAFAYAFEAETLDDALDLFDMLIADIAASAKQLGKKNRLRTLRDLDKASIALAHVCSMLLNDNRSAVEVRTSIFAEFPQERIAQAINTVNNLARPPEDNYQQEALARYKTVRRFLSKVLESVPFKAAPAGRSVLHALHYLESLQGRRNPSLNNAPLDVVDAGWKRLVLDKTGQINQAAYTLCVLERLQDRLRRRDVYVDVSERWGDPRAKLLNGRAWEKKRINVCRSLNLPSDPDQVIRDLSDDLDAAYRQVTRRFENNQAIRVERENGKPSLTISNLDKLDEPTTLLALREQVSKLMPQIDLAELLLEVQAKTGFADEFTHVSEAKSRIGDLPTSVCAVLLGEACNIGIRAVAHRDNPALLRGRLHWVQQNYIRAETLTRANARLVNHQSMLAPAKEWGGGEVASADGLRFTTPVRTVNSGPNRKYFGADRGITYYNFTSDQYTGFHNIVVPGTLRDSIYILEGLLEQKTGLNPTEIMADTAGSSDMVFGLFWLLGYQFSPRLADAGEASFWRIDAGADYGALNEISRHRARPERIKQHWDDMLRIAGSLKLGTVHASELMRSLLKSHRPSSLAQAIIELGRINRTIYLLHYIDDEEYRRRILTQLNRGEGRHKVARTICHGRRGEIRKTYREGQEDQLSALGLVTNAVVLWNTIYIQAAFDHLRDEGVDVKREDAARLSPLQHKHLNVLGRYSFALDGQIAKGELRSLNFRERGEALA
ncbi:Tn3 family transposase [Gammaproteobacteria bacterium]|nr:Tn3 family transposase [Gammaproteobacteria bacterium]